MRFVLVTAVAFGSVAFATKHGHAHGHMHREHNHKHDLVRKDLVEEIVEVTVTECWLDGRVIPSAECEEGVRNGTLKFVNGGNIQNPPPQTTFSTIKGSVTTISVPVEASSNVPQSPTLDYGPTSSTLATQSSTLGDEPLSTSSANVLASVNQEFPDGQLDCSEFPSDYGAIPLNWLDIGGWASVQKPNQQTSAGYSDILTVTNTQCEGTTCCLEGSFCSYACPNDYLKSQWPQMQGATGESIGGVLCQNGKLHLTRPEVKTLCSLGSTVVNITVKNTLTQNVAICRTNYPGDEKMSLPLNVNPGETKPVACPDAATYYTWENKSTSAQYYMNMPGYSVEKACVWGESGDDFGNWAPGNIGVGFSEGRAWVSMFPNWPTQKALNLPYTIEIIGGSTNCKYQGGQYCTGNNYETCSNAGCTVSADSGELTYILS